MRALGAENKPRLQPELLIAEVVVTTGNVEALALTARERVGSGSKAQLFGTWSSIRQWSSCAPSGESVVTECVCRALHPRCGPAPLHADRAEWLTQSARRRSFERGEVCRRLAGHA